MCGAFAMTFVPLFNVNCDALSTRFNNHYVHFLIVNLMEKQKGKKKKKRALYFVSLSTATEHNTPQKRGGACEQDYTGLVLLLGHTSSAGEIFSARCLWTNTTIRTNTHPQYTCTHAHT